MLLLDVELEVDSARASGGYAELDGLMVNWRDLEIECFEKYKP